MLKRLISGIDTPEISLIDSLTNSIKENRLTEAFAMIERNPDLANMYDSSGLAPIHYLALCETNSELFQKICKSTDNILMKAGVDSGYEGKTVLHIVAMGEDLNGEENKTISEEFSRNIEHLDILNIDELDEEGETPLMAAVSNSNICMTLCFIENKADISLEDPEGWSVMERAENAKEDGEIEEAKEIFDILTTHQDKLIAEEEEARKEEEAREARSLARAAARAARDRLAEEFSAAVLPDTALSTTASTTAAPVVKKLRKRDRDSD